MQLLNCVFRLTTPPASPQTLVWTGGEGQPAIWHLVADDNLGACDAAEDHRGGEAPGKGETPAEPL